MKYLHIALGVLIVLSLSRFIPHPPNFTSLIALSFYVPALFGRKYILAVVLSFAITDLIIGYHNGTFFSWGSVVAIGLMSVYFTNNFLLRISGALLGALIFFIVTNFGVWVSGMYGYSLAGFISCYILAIPFFAYSFISTLMFSSIIEILYKFYTSKVAKDYY